MKLFTACLFFIFAALHVSHAQDTEPKKAQLRFLLGGALELGGDEVAEVYFTNGEAQSVNAGQGISIAVGAEYQFPKLEKLLLRGTVGFKYVTTQADNAHIRLTRFPMHLTANWMATEKIRLGAGLVTHRGISFEADGLGHDIEFDGATGPVFEFAYGPVGLSYTIMTYKDQYNLSYSANAIGLTFSFAFKKR